MTFSRNLGRSLVAGAAMLAVAGCATATPPTPALLTYAADNCVTAPDLTTAISLLPEKDKAVWTVDQPMDAAGPCLDWQGLHGPYLVFALPEERWNAPIEIGSVVETLRIFSPHVVLLDEAGSEVRSFTPEQYNFRASGYGRTYAVQFLPQDGERFVLVTSNPLRVGELNEAIITSTATTTYWTGFGAANWTSGVESNLAQRFSYDGNIRANVFRPAEEEED